VPYFSIMGLWMRDWLRKQELRPQIEMLFSELLLAGTAERLKKRQSS
jgi:hypothetical protein